MISTVAFESCRHKPLLHASEWCWVRNAFPVNPASLHHHLVVSSGSAARCRPLWKAFKLRRMQRSLNLASKQTMIRQKTCTWSEFCLFAVNSSVFWALSLTYKLRSIFIQRMNCMHLPGPPLKGTTYYPCTSPAFVAPPPPKEPAALSDLSWWPANSSRHRGEGGQ